MQRVLNIKCEWKKRRQESTSKPNYLCEKENEIDCERPLSFFRSGGEEFSLHLYFFHLNCAFFLISERTTKLMHSKTSFVSPPFGFFIWYTSPTFGSTKMPQWVLCKTNTPFMLTSASFSLNRQTHIIW